jgi:hypothetical protein
MVGYQRFGGPRLLSVHDPEDLDLNIDDYYLERRFFYCLGYVASNDITTVNWKNVEGTDCVPLLRNLLACPVVTEENHELSRFKVAGHRCRNQLVGWGF